MVIMAIMMAFIGHVFQKTCKGTKKYAHTQITNIFFLKKIDFIYPTTTPIAHWELARKWAVGVVVREAKPFFLKICEWSEVWAA